MSPSNQMAHLLLEGEVHTVFTSLLFQAKDGHFAGEVRAGRGGGGEGEGRGGEKYSLVK